MVPRSYRGRVLINQDPSALVYPDAPRLFLPILFDVIKAVEDYTGFAWKITSYVRQSPSHKTGSAIDIAPHIHPDFEKYYAVYHASDPVLYKREPLLRQLQSLTHHCSPPVGYDVGLFVEPDHIHIGVLEQEAVYPRILLFKWKVPKLVYPDTYERMKLPMTSRPYRSSFSPLNS